MWFLFLVLLITTDCMVRRYKNDSGIKTADFIQ
jgi:hypothetical protein